MKISKLAVFCGAAASWTGYPSGRTRSFFRPSTATVIDYHHAGCRFRKRNSGLKGFHPNSAKPSGCCNDFSVRANIRPQPKSLICPRPSFCVPYVNWHQIFMNNVLILLRVVTVTTRVLALNSVPRLRTALLFGQVQSCKLLFIPSILTLRTQVMLSVNSSLWRL